MSAAVFQAVLFDLDGTLIDSAPDLAGAGNEMRAARGLVWGIVTNKSHRVTTPLVKALGLDVEAGAVICGDTTPHSKPHPEPLLEAARR